MKKMILVALAAALSAGSISTSYAQQDPKCKKECCKKCKEDCSKKCDDKKSCSKEAAKA
ncbi:MAG: hypothetical protein H7122_01225 [Chitinophagaceae bacterium]|nr:hypothetical protein [Chitinophagaceae bacterium]